MRPIKLEISAFQSYAGKEIIDFNKLGDQGLFLISGETGAGKTTIFDAISYALFGSASGVSRSAAMLRSEYAQGTIETYVELTFSYNGKEYKIRRSPAQQIKYNPNKEDLRNFSTKAWLILPEKDEEGNQRQVHLVSEVNKKINEIIGLDKDKFSQITMIAQGEFRKLIESDTKGRGEILREVFKTTPYEAFQKLVYAKSKTKEEELKSLKSEQLIYVKQFTCSGDIDERLKQSLENTKAKDNITKEDLNLFEEILKIENKRLDTFRKEKLELEKELKVIAKIIEEDKKKREEQRNLEAHEEKLKEIIEDLEKAKLNLDEIEKKHDVKALNDEIVKDEEKLVEYKQLDHISTEIIALEKALSTKKEEKEQKEKYIKAREELVGESNKQLKKLGDNLEKDKTKAIEEKNIKHGRLEKVKDLIDDIKEYTKLKKETEEKQKISSDLTKDLTIASKEYAQINETYLNQQAGILAKDLKEGVACPVCGSTKHPKKAKIENENITKESVDKAKAKQEEANENASNASSDAAIALGACEAELKDIEKTYKDIYKKDFNKDEKTLQDLEKEQNLLEKGIQDLEEQIRKRKEDIEEKERLETLVKAKKKEIEKLNEEKNKVEIVISSNSASKSEKEKQKEQISKGLKYESKERAEGELKEKRENLEKINESIKNAKEEKSKMEADKNTTNGYIKKAKEDLKNYKPIDLVKEEKREEETHLKKDAKEDEIEKIATIVKNNEDKIKYIGKLLEKIGKNEKILSSILTLSNVVNGKLVGEDRLSLETYILMNYFDKIIARANKRFNAMTLGKLEMIRKTDKQGGSAQSGLELNVYDYYSGTERSAKSLSGGESFMAALSLALALSEEIQESAGGVQIDTIFIDEGFGSLDSETLKEAIKALADLAEGNILIGLISHVDELKRKIDNKIIVSKNDLGHSNVKVEGINIA